MNGTGTNQPKAQVRQPVVCRPVIAEDVRRKLVKYSTATGRSMNNATNWLLRLALKAEGQ